MKCKDIHDWLPARDIHIPDESPDPMTHIKACPSCKELYEVDVCLESCMKTAFSQETLPLRLKDRVDLCLEQAAAPDTTRPVPAARLPKTGRLKAAGLAATVLILAVTGFLLLYQKGPSFQTLHQLGEEAAINHLKGNRSISFHMADLPHAMDMLKKELGFNLILPDLAPEGYTMLGGRLCALGRCKAAYFIVEKQGRKGSLFIMDHEVLTFRLADGSRFISRIRGCATRVWKDNGQVYAMVY